MTLVEQWNAIESGLDPSWVEAQLTLDVADPTRVDRAAALLGPTNPGRFGSSLRMSVARRGGGVGPDAIRRLLRRIDQERIPATLKLAASASAASPSIAEPERLAFVDAWEAELAQLPSDWSDLYCELRLTSTDYLDRTALLTAPLNPQRFDSSPSYRFRCARSFGYGTAPSMVRRCLERLDAERINGTVRVLTALSDTHPVGTQGPLLEAARLL